MLGSVFEQAGYRLSYATTETVRPRPPPLPLPLPLPPLPPVSPAAAARALLRRPPPRPPPQRCAALTQWLLLNTEEGTFKIGSRWLPTMAAGGPPGELDVKLGGTDELNDILACIDAANAAAASDQFAGELSGDESSPENDPETVATVVAAAQKSPGTATKDADGSPRVHRGSGKRAPSPPVADATDLPLTETNLYRLLGLDESAAENDIKRRYHAMALQHHPDKGGLAENFKKIARAYEILSDPAKRQRYDETGAVDEDQYDEGDERVQPYDDMFPAATEDEFKDTAWAANGDDAVDFTEEQMRAASDSSSDSEETDEEAEEAKAAAEDAEIAGQEPQELEDGEDDEEDEDDDEDDDGDDSSSDEEPEDDQT